MKLTPLDIRHKEFRRAFRGYSDEEVDVFLDEVADEFERLFQDNIEQRDRLQRVQEQVAQYESLKDTLQKTLVSAQQQSDAVRANARKEAELILKDAELKNRDILHESYSEKQRTQQSLIQLRQTEEDFRFKFRSLLEAHLNSLAEDELPEDRRRFRGLVSGVEGELGQEFERPTAEDSALPGREPAVAAAMVSAIDFSSHPSDRPRDGRGPNADAAVTSSDADATAGEVTGAASGVEAELGAPDVPEANQPAPAAEATAAEDDHRASLYEQFFGPSSHDEEKLAEPGSGYERGPGIVSTEKRLAGEHGRGSSVRRLLFGRRARDEDKKSPSASSSSLPSSSKPEDRDFQW